MKRLSIRALAALAVCAFLAAPAHADIKAYNAAMKAGDYKTAAAEAKSIWQSWDQSKPETATIAREFGFAALVAGENDEAREFGQFLVEKGASLLTPDDQPLISAVLFRAADYKLTHQAPALAALRSALTARTAGPGVDMTSVISWELLYTSDGSTGAWTDAQTDSAAAVAYFGRSPILKPRQHDAEIFAAASSFIAGRNRITQGKNSYYSAMADVHDRITADIEAATPPMQAQLWPLKWKAEAWALAMEVYLTSAYQQIGSIIDKSVKPRTLIQPKVGQYPEDSSLANVPLCKGKWDGPTIFYPANSEYNGLVGAVIVRLITGVDGKVTKVDVVAAVPTIGFAEHVTDTLQRWRFVPDNGTAGCRLNSSNHFIRLTFRIGS